MYTRFCSNCNTRNPGPASSCYRCNAPLTPEERERRREQRIENELREMNGKEPLPVEEIDETVEPVEPGRDALLALILYLTIGIGGSALVFILILLL